LSYSCIFVENKVMKVLGNHILVEYYKCDKKKINDCLFIEKSLIEAAKASGAQIVETKLHHFSPQGISGIVILKESHITIHTWPEYAYAAVDIFTCGSHIQPKIACEYLSESFDAQESISIKVPRGDKKKFLSKTQK